MVYRRLLPHGELLVAILRRPAVGDEIRDRIQLLNHPEPRAAFQREASQHGVLGMALSELDRTPELVAVLSPDAAEALLSPLPQLRRQAAFWDLERSRVLRRLQDGGVDPILLKGAALRITTYAESVERPLADVDVLVHDHEMRAAIAALESAQYFHAFGDLRTLYKAHHFHFVMQHPGGFTVELHWDLTRPSAQVVLDAEAFRARSRRLDAPDPWRVPSPEDMVLHLICQNLEDGFSKLRRTMDVDRVVSRHSDFDWTYLVESAKRAGAGTAAALALQLSSRLLGTRLPQSNAADMFDVHRAARVGLACVDPVINHVHPFSRRGDLRRDLLQLWAAGGSKSWFWGLRQRLLVDHYRFWGVTSGRAIPTRLNRTVRVAKLLALQVWSYVTALAGLVTRPHGAALRFWNP